MRLHLICERLVWVCVRLWVRSREFLLIRSPLGSRKQIYRQTKVRPFPSLNTNTHTLNLEHGCCQVKPEKKFHATLFNQAFNFLWFFFPSRKHFCLFLPISLIYSSPRPSFPRIVWSRGRWEQVWHPVCSDLKTLPPVKFITSPCWIQKEKQEEKNSTLKTSYPACSRLVFDRKMVGRHAASFVILKFVGNT